MTSIPGPAGVPRRAPSGADPSGADPSGADPSGADPSGADPSGAGDAAAHGAGGVGGAGGDGAAAPSDWPGDATAPVLSDPVAVEGLGRVVAGVDGLAGREAWRLSDADLATLVQGVEVVRRRLLMVQARVVAEAGKRGLPRRAGFGPARGVRDGDTVALAAWVRSLVNVTRADARHLVEVGAVLFTDPVAADLVETRAAALSGRIGSRHVAAIAAAVTELSPPHVPVDPASGEPAVDEGTRRDAQRVLAQQAAVLDPVQTKVLAKRTVAVLDPGAGERLAKDEDLRDSHRGLSFTNDGSGLVHLHGTLTPVCAGLLATAIDAASAPQPAADGTPDARTAAMRRHDGLAHVLAQVVAADGLLPSTHGSPYRLVVTVPHATLTATLADRTRAGAGHGPARAGAADRVGTAGAGTAGGACAGDTGPVLPGAEPVLPGLLPDGFPLSPLAAQTMACSADLVPVLVGEDHQPLDVGDTQYPFPAKVRTAIITRDGGCTYPGCGAPAPWCDTHHLIKFADGGSTSVTNGALLCGRHHRYVHALGLTGRVTTGDGASHVHWDHRPTSWTATTATITHDAAPAAGGSAATTTGRSAATMLDGTAATPPAPALTDRCLDELIRRWQRRRQAQQHQGRQRQEQQRGRPRAA